MALVEENECGKRKNMKMGERKEERRKLSRMRAWVVVLTQASERECKGERKGVQRREKGDVEVRR